METLNNEATAQQKITETVGKFIGLIGKRLPDDVGKRLVELEKEEVAPLSKVVYQSMMDNQDKAMKTEPSILSRYRCYSILHQMRIEFPFHRRLGRSIDRIRT